MALPFTIIFMKKTLRSYCPHFSGYFLLQYFVYNWCVAVMSSLDISETLILQWCENRWTILVRWRCMIIGIALQNFNPLFGSAAVAMSLAFGMHSVSSGIWLAKKDFVVVRYRRHGKAYFVVYVRYVRVHVDNHRHFSAFSCPFKCRSKVRRR